MVRGKVIEAGQAMVSSGGGVRTAENRATWLPLITPKGNQWSQMTMMAWALPAATSRATASVATMDERDGVRDMEHLPG